MEEEMAKLNLSEEAKTHIDLETGLMYTGGSAEIYLSILEVYVNDGMEKKTAIEALYAAENWKDYVIAVHALKSTSLTIGAVELSELAKKLELAGKAGEYDTIHRNQQLLLEKYQEILLIGAQILADQTMQVSESAPEDGTAPVELQPGELQGILEELTEACASFDGDRILEIAEKLKNGSCRGIFLGNCAEEIRAASDAFDYETVEAIGCRIAALTDL